MKKIRTYILVFGAMLFALSCKPSHTDDPLNPEPNPLNAITFGIPVAEEEVESINAAPYSPQAVATMSQPTMLDNGATMRTYGNAVSKSTAPTRAITSDFVTGDKVKLLGYFLDDGAWNSTPSTPASNEIPNFMYDQSLTLGTDNKWNYEPLKYWSNDPADRYRFFGYYPTTSTSVALATENNEPGYPKINFTNIPTTNLTTQVDLLYAQTDVLSKEASSTSIELPFEHALSKVRISAKKLNTAYIVQQHCNFVVKSLTINSPTKATLSGSQTGASWSGHNTNADWAFDYTDAGTLQGLDIPIATQTTPAVMLVGGEDPNDALLQIPREGPITITVVFDYEYAVRPGDPYYETIEDLSYTITLDDEFEAGKAYHYQLEFGHADHRPKVTVTSNFTDWGATFDINTSVEYTYLYVEKPDFLFEYTSLDPINFKVFFVTNAPADSVAVSLFREEGATYPAKQQLNTVTRGYSEEEGWHAICTLHPETSYDKEEIIIKAGLINIKVVINLVAQQPFYLMDPKSLNDYLGLDPAEGIVTQTMYSNSYLITPHDKYARKYYIPVTEQLQYAQTALGMTEDLTQTNTAENNTWKVKLYAYDNPEPTNMLWLYNEGEIFRPVDEGGLGEAYAQQCFSIVIPANYKNHGNMLVTVSDLDDNILWTWHLWITDYDPYFIYKDVLEPEVIKGDVITEGTTTATAETYVYHSEKYKGTIYRHNYYDFSYVLDRNIGATAPTFNGHGGLGTTGWLVYQYGRVTPILGYNARWADGSVYNTIKHNVDELGQVSLMEGIQNPNTIYYSPSGNDWCSANIRGKVWNDVRYDHPAHPSSGILPSAGTPSYYKKSRFDPSPLGYMMHPLTEISTYYDAWEIKQTAEGVNYYEMSSGNIIYGSTNISSITGNTSLSIQDIFSLWSNSSYPSNNRAGSLGFGYRSTSPFVYYNTSTSRTTGAPIRCIDQFEETRANRNWPYQTPATTP